MTHYRKTTVGGRGGKSVQQSRLVWEAEHGPIPPGHIIDHIDGDIHNNSLDNLQCITYSQNTGRSNSQRGKYKRGVERDGRMINYRAVSFVGGKRRTIGLFPSEDEAHLAYLYDRQARLGCVI